LTICQLRTATARLAPIWWVNGRCSRPLAESIADQLARTQRRNAKACRYHRKRTIARLHAAGLHLSNMKTCHWPRL